MKKLVKPIVLFSLCLLMADCARNDNDYKSKLDVKVEPVSIAFERYEDVLFSLDTANFQSALMVIQDQYQVFLGGDLTDTNAVQYLKDFATDPFSVSIYEKVKQAFPNLDEVKPMVDDVLAHFHYYYPEIQLPEKVYTCVTGINADEPAVQIIDNSLVISLDWYLDGDEVYDQIGMPKYMQPCTRLATLARDVAKQLYMTYLYQWRKQGDVLNEMIYSGRLDFFIEAMCPKMTDDVLMSWSPEQLEWFNGNEGAVWADIVGQRLLYETSLDSYLMFFGDGPFTQAYGNDSPARLGEYFGLKIIRSYMASHDLSLNQLIENPDFQGVFQDSGYKPRK